MAEQYCWSCGAKVRRSTGELAALCGKCRRSGPQLGDQGLRWMARTSDGRVRGPLARDSVVDQLRSGALTDTDFIARDGGGERTIGTHRDFRRYFIPGTPEYADLTASVRSERSKGRKFRASRALRRAGAAFLLVGVAGVAVIGTERDWFVVSEDAVESFLSVAGEAGEVIEERVRSAVDEEAAARKVQAERALPGEGLVAAAQEAHPDRTGAATLHLTQGRELLWRGTDESHGPARREFELALALAPRDPEAAAGLAKALAALYERQPDVSEAMSQAAERARALAPGSVAALSARAAVAAAVNNAPLAIDLGTQCIEASRDTEQSGGGDLGCRLLVAELEGDLPALEDLSSTYGDVYPIRLAHLNVALRVGRTNDAIRISENIRTQYPREVEPWAVAARALLSAGRFADALEAASAVLAMEPAHRTTRVLRAEVLLKVSRDAKGALDDYEYLVTADEPLAVQESPQLYADAAAAALEVGNPSRALQFASMALGREPGHPAASLQKARAHVVLGQGAEAESTLGDSDLTSISGFEEARYHVGAARVLLALGRERTAVGELRSARETAPHWPLPVLEAASAQLRVANLGGSIEFVEELAFMDIAGQGGINPLSDIWLPATSVFAFGPELERALLGDIRYAERAPTVLGVGAWAAGDKTGLRLLQRVASQKEEAPVAHAVLAQNAMSKGDVASARRHAEACLRVEQDHPMIRVILGRALVQQGRTDAGVVEINRALQEAADSPGVRRHAALAFAAMKDAARTRESWEALERLSPNNLDARLAILAMDEGGR